MSTPKSTKKTVSRSHAAKTSGAKTRGNVRASARPGQNATSLAIPTAALLGTGALAAGAYILREELAELLHTAVKDGMSMTKRLDFPKLLAFAGIRRRRSFLSSAAPQLSGLAVGLVSGAALTLWLGPKIGGRIDAGPVIPAQEDGPGASTSEPAFESPVPPPHISR